MNTWRIILELNRYDYVITTNDNTTNTTAESGFFSERWSQSEVCTVQYTYMYSIRMSTGIVLLGTIINTGFATFAGFFFFFF